MGGFRIAQIIVLNALGIAYDLPVHDVPFPVYVPCVVMRSISVITESIDITVMGDGCTLVNIWKETSIRKVDNTKQTPKILQISQQKLNCIVPQSD